MKTSGLVGGVASGKSLAQMLVELGSGLLDANRTRYAVIAVDKLTLSIAEGEFAGPNPALKQGLEIVHQDPYGAGWLYQVKGAPDSRCMDVHAYQQFLDKTIDKILEKQKDEEIE